MSSVSLFTCLVRCVTLPYSPCYLYSITPSLFRHAALEKQATLPHSPAGLQPTFLDFPSHSFFETVLPAGVMPSDKSRGHFDHYPLAGTNTLHYSLLHQPHSSHLPLPLSHSFLILDVVCLPPQVVLLWPDLYVSISNCLPNVLACVHHENLKHDSSNHGIHQLHSHSQTTSPCCPCLVNSATSRSHPQPPNPGVILTTSPKCYACNQPLCLVRAASSPFPQSFLSTFSPRYLHMALSLTLACFCFCALCSFA